MDLVRISLLILSESFKFMYFRAPATPFSFSSAQMENIFALGWGKYPHDVYGPRESEKSEWRVHTANLQRAKYAADGHGRDGYLLSARAMYKILFPE